MIYLILPISPYHGWGICGKNLGRELLQLTPIRYLACNGYDLGAHAFDKTAYGQLAVNAMGEHAPLIQAADWDMTPWGGQFSASRKVGLIFTDRMIHQEQINAWKGYWDVLVAGSRWCQQVLAGMGIASIVICQGIDPLLFNEGYATKQLLKDNFVVFSGGKFEFKKSQDLVIRAFQIFQQRHDDVVLVAAWFNQWLENMRTMQASRHIRFTTTATDYESIVKHTLAENDIDLRRVLVLGPMHNSIMSSAYQNSDVGVFPHRGEAGTNLVLMEYMACGKPAIVSFFAGHTDIADDSNAILMKSITTCQVYGPNRELIGDWGEPSISDIVDRLEWAYQHQTEVARLGTAAAVSMKSRTWRRMAEEMLPVVQAAG